MRVLCLVGRSGVGKTALLERAVSAMTERGLTVLAVKRSHHRFPDDPGTDSARLAQAGARGVALWAEDSAFFWGASLPFEKSLACLAPQYQAALVEGGKGLPWPRVELLGEDPPLLAPQQVVAYLPRGPRDCPETLERFLELWHQHAQRLA